MKMAKRKTTRKKKANTRRQYNSKPQNKSGAMREFLKTIPTHQLKTATVKEIKQAAKMPSIVDTSVSALRRDEMRKRAAENGAVNDLETLVQVKRFADRIGGIEVLKEIVKTLEVLK